MCKKLAILLLALGSILAGAQQGLNNDAIGKMIKAGLSDEIIVTTINSNPGSYDTSPDGLIALKAAGASDRVITAIQKKSVRLVLPSPSSSPAGVLGAVMGSISAAPTVREPEQMGKLFYLNPATKHLDSLPGERWRRKNRSGFASVKYVNIVDGQHSSFRVSSKDKIVFVFRPLPNLLSGFGLQKIQIYPFEVKGEDRECIVESTKGGFGGGSHVGNENTISLDVVKYGTFSYALNPPGFHLNPGEYWIELPGAGLNDPLVTFGVD